MRDNLANEHVLKTDVVANRRDHREIGDEIDSCERRPPFGDRMHEFHGNMRSVTTRTAVAHREQSSTFAIDVSDSLRHRNKGGRLLAKKTRISLARVARLLFDRVEQCSFEFCWFLLGAMQEWVKCLEVAFIDHGAPTSVEFPRTIKSLLTESSVVTIHAAAGRAPSGG